MLPSTRYKLEILQIPKQPTLSGDARHEWDYHVTLTWDGRIWLQANAPSPAALGRIVGEAVRGMAEDAESGRR